MFIYNLKLDTKNTAKIIFIILSIIVLILLGIAVYKMFKEDIKVNDMVDHPDIAYIDSNNYTNILRDVYNDIDSHLGQKICFTGYIYRLMDFKDNQFILARNMKTDNSSKVLVVGFLCESDNAKKFQDDVWVEIIGEISKGTYHSTIPIIKIFNIKEVTKPDYEFVPKPDDTYVPTALIY